MMTIHGTYSFHPPALLLILMLLFASLISFSQADSSTLDIRNYSESKSQRISRWRNILTDQFLAGKLKEVKKIKDFLVNEIEDETYLALFTEEVILIDYWTGDFDQICRRCLQSLEEDSRLTQTRSKCGKITPMRDQLYQVLLEKTAISVPMLGFNIMTGGSDTEEKEFLLLNLRSSVRRMLAEPQVSDTLNSLSDEFIRRYPGSIYIPYVRSQIRFVYKPAKWGFAFEFFSGYGIFTHELAYNYKNNIPIGVAFDVSYRRLVLYLRDYIGFSKTVTDIPYPAGTWSSGSQVRVFLPEASLGYVVAENRLIKLAPFAGIGSTDIGPTSNDTKEDPDLKEVDLKFTTTWVAGFSVDLKLNGFRKKTMGKRTPSSFGFLRLHYTFAAPQFGWHYDDRYGFMHCITLGIGGFSRNDKRDY